VERQRDAALKEQVALDQHHFMFFALRWTCALSLQAFKRKLAAKNNCDATCPVSTSIFLRIVTEHAWEEYNRTGSTRDVAPFWRVVESSSPLAKKLSFDPAWIDLQRELEFRMNP
jgi:hypothetical protein